MDLLRLRCVLRPRIIVLKDSGPRHTFPAICESLGLPPPGPDGSKRDAMNDCFDALPDAELPRFAERLLKLHPPEASVRNEIEDVLWVDKSIEIPKKFRRDVAKSIAGEELYLDAKRFDELLERLWVLGNDLSIIFGGPDRSLRAEIRKHVHDNPGDWSAEELFDIGQLEWKDFGGAIYSRGGAR